MGPGDLGIGHRLWQERLVAGKSREELAKLVGIDCSLLQTYETGERPIPARHLVAAITALGVPLSLFTYDIVPRGSTISDRETDRGPWYTVPRPLSLLRYPDFAQAQPVLRLWKANRGTMTDDLFQALVAGRVTRRTLLLRQGARRSRLTFEHFDAAINMMRACETLSLVVEKWMRFPIVITEFGWPKATPRPHGNSVRVWKQFWRT